MKPKAWFLSSICVGSIITPAFAQEALSGDRDLEEINPVIVVTAQRQAQSLREVPIAVSAFDA